MFSFAFFEFTDFSNYFTLFPIFPIATQTIFLNRYSEAIQAVSSSL